MLPLFVPSSAGPPGPIIPALAGPLLAERSVYQLPPLLRDLSKARVPVIESELIRLHLSYRIVKRIIFFK